MHPAGDYERPLRHAHHRFDGRRGGGLMTASGMDEAAEELEFVGDITDYWSYTQVRDWVLLRPGMTRTALHLYLLLRAMVSETARRTGGGLRRMSLDQLCYLLPGVNDKPASLTMVKDALRLLDEHGLVVNPEGGRLVTSTGKGGIQNSFRKYQVNDLPPDEYVGWRNVWDKLDAYTPDWRDNPAVPPAHTRTKDGVHQHPGRKSDSRTDQVRSSETAGRFDGRKSDESGRKSDRTGRKKNACRSVTSENAVPKETPQRSSSLSSAPAATAAPTARAETETEKRGESSAAPETTATAPAAGAPSCTPVVEAWANGMKAGGRPFLPRRAAAISAEATELLAAGADLDHLCRVAEWMGRMKPTWRILEDAMTWPEAPQPRTRVSHGGRGRTGAQAAVAACQVCDSYGQIERDGRVRMCRHDGEMVQEPAVLPQQPAAQAPAPAQGNLGDLLRSMRQPAI
jgi:hypothetical protein